MDPEDIRQLEFALRAASGVNLMLEFGPLAQNASPYAVESALMTRANAKRQQEFYSGRHLARKALGRAGITPSGIGRGALGNPLWPVGYTGSITHDQTWGLAIAVESTGVLGLGIDLLERPENVTENVSRMILSNSERALLNEQCPDIPAVALAFSLKEAVVKAVSVEAGRFLDFLDIKLTWKNNALTASVRGMSVPCRVFFMPCGVTTFAYFSP